MGFTCYQTFFDLCHKIRVVIGKRGEEYRLKDKIEYYEAYITKATSTKEKNAKRGRGTQQKAMVTVMAESTVLEDFKKGKLTKSVYILK